MRVRFFPLVCLVIIWGSKAMAQSNDCVFKPPFYLLHFGRGNVQDVNEAVLALYNRVSTACPGDGHYSYTPYTSDCFGGDWHAIEDHTPGDAGGNMLLVNSAYDEGLFLSTRVKGFKGGATYQFGAWLMNVCRPSKKCPFPLLPNLLIRLQTPSGKMVAQFSTGELLRVPTPHWTQHRAVFTVPPTETELILTMLDTAPGGCGNDFALDDISFRECVKPDPAKLVETKKTSLVTVKKTPLSVKKEPKKTPVVPSQPKPVNVTVTVTTSNNALSPRSEPVPAPNARMLVPPPPVLQQRTTTVAKQIETGSGEVLLDLYDNGEIDGDTVSIYHNNELVVSRQRLSQKPISFRIQVGKNSPHHELVMVANNLGAIPPNTSVMMVTTKDKRYQVYISSTEQQNAKVVIDLKE